ncbi:MAG: response regulator [Saprospiraceae bacterium]
MRDKNDLIFIVDDDDFFIEVMRQVLICEGIENVQSFSTGNDCISALSLNPSIIFFDHELDETSGYNTLKSIKSYNSEVFVVMMSCMEDIDTTVTTLKHGAFDYIKKDENLAKKTKSLLIRINAVNHLLEQQKSSILKSVYKYS